ncbi:MAG: Ldh family oxidoreductase [Acidimicrobiia bacterium]
MTRVDLDELRRLVLDCLEPRFSDQDATRIADVLMFGEMANRPSHGIIRLLPGSFGVMDEEPGSEPSIEMHGHSAARVTGRQGMILASIAVELAEELATASGFAVVTTSGSRSTSGSLAYYVERLANAGLVSFVSAGTPNFVSIPGGGARLLGTNPVAYGIPTRDVPFVLDMGTSAITGGDVLTAVADGSDLPSGVAVDASGAPTTHAADVLDGGALLPFGGHKGLGLSLTVEILNKALTGASGDPGDWGHVFVAFSASLFGDEDDVRRRAQAEVDRLQAAGARIPGHHTLRCRDDALQRGWVEVDDDVYKRVVDSVS